MSLAEQTARVAGGGKNALKVILQKLGVTVGEVPIDQYADLAGQISEKLLPDNLATAETAQLFGLDDNAPVREILEKIKELFDATDSSVSELNSAKARIVTGYYTGNGKYGADNPNSITFDGKIKIVCGTDTYTIPDYFSTSAEIRTIDQLTTSYVADRGFGRTGRSYGKISADQKTFSWYSDEGADEQNNLSGKKYTYFAILEDE